MKTAFSCAFVSASLLFGASAASAADLNIDPIIIDEGSHSGIYMAARLGLARLDSTRFNLVATTPDTAVENNYKRSRQYFGALALGMDYGS